MIPESHLFLILTACFFDAVVGDPAYALHPIRLLGRWIAICERGFFALGLDGYGGGAMHLLLVTGSALAIWWVIGYGLGAIQPWLAWGWDVFVAYSLLCMKDLLVHGRRVLKAIGDLPAARRQLAMLVGRDTEFLGQDGIVRATIESLSENLTDGVLTPLWALCLFGLPGLIVVKVVSSLDSMVGYKNDRYRRFGFSAARTDDLINWLPARLSVPLVALAATLTGLYPKDAWRAGIRYHDMLPSPNSGWSEAACAGALRVRLLGPIYYGGVLVSEVFMGDPDWPWEIGARELRLALRLLTVCCLLAVGFGIIPLVPRSILDFM